MINIQIVVALVIINFIYIIIHFFIIFHLKNRFKVRFGPSIGQSISQVEISDINQNKSLLNNVLGNKKSLLLFVDMDCDHCNKIINSLKLINRSGLSQIQFLLANTEENIRGVKEKNLEGNFYFLDENVLFNSMNIKGFPFFIEIDNKNVIENKGYASSNVIIEYLL